MAYEVWRWVGFHILIGILLLLDFGVFHRKSRAVSRREAALWSVFWIGLSLLFNVFIYVYEGQQKALEFFTGYLVEKSLSVDNIFVFILIFSYFQVPKKLQHRVLYLGIIGALVLRLALILAGVSLINRFAWLIYLLGIFLAYTGIRLMLRKEEKIAPEKNYLVRWTRKHFDVTEDYHGSRFWIRKAGKLFATPLVLVLIVIETTDLVFALDSIPAIFAITLDPFIVYTSNIFAVLGLRSLHFLIAESLLFFSHLQIGLGLVLFFVGFKMVMGPFFHIPLPISLGVIAGILVASMLTSLIYKK
ncbi:MAG: TerC family protein [Verrucomicrobia bacterium]|nr:TerC family protein [Verrucomicrobiota bacterium]